MLKIQFTKVIKNARNKLCSKNCECSSSWKLALTDSSKHRIVCGELVGVGRPMDEVPPGQGRCLHSARVEVGYWDD